MNEDPIDVCLADGCYVFEAHSDAKFEGQGSWVVEAADSAGRLQQVSSGISPAVCSFSIGESAYCPNQSVSASDNVFTRPHESLRLAREPLQFRDVVAAMASSRDHVAATPSTRPSEN